MYLNEPSIYKCVWESVSHVQLLLTWCTIARFSRQEYGNRLPFPPPEGLPDPGIESQSPALQSDFFPSEPRYAIYNYRVNNLWTYK